MSGFPVRIDDDTRDYVSSLIISNVDQTDCGAYYCVIENTDGQCHSQQAELIVKETLAHWTLNSDDYTGSQYSDVSGHGHAATVSGTPLLRAGADGAAGGAVYLTSSSGSGTAGTWNPSQDTGQMSVSAWVNWTGGSDTSIMLTNQRLDASQMMWTWGLILQRGKSILFPRVLRIFKHQPI
jgi:hypothetical protein